LLTNSTYYYSFIYSYSINLNRWTILIHTQIYLLLYIHYYVWIYLIWKCVQTLIYSNFWHYQGCKKLYKVWANCLGLINGYINLKWKSKCVQKKSQPYCGIHKNEMFYLCKYHHLSTITKCFMFYITYFDFKESLTFVI
jgi:hypothetical protein